jgi:cytidine deaminase
LESCEDKIKLAPKQINFMKIVPFDKLSKKDQELIIEAEKVICNAYDPYSQFYVASAVLSKKGNIYKGVNINTCSYGGICAERAALSSMVSNGEYCIEKVAIIAKSDHYKVKILSGPCGICRQMLWEFAELCKNNFHVIISDSEKKRVLVARIKELHPKGFGPRLCCGDYKKYLDKIKSLRVFKRKN